MNHPIVAPPPFNPRLPPPGFPVRQAHSYPKVSSESLLQFSVYDPETQNSVLSGNFRRWLCALSRILLHVQPHRVRHYNKLLLIELLASSVAMHPWAHQTAFRKDVLLLKEPRRQLCNFSNEFLAIRQICLINFSDQLTSLVTM